MGDVLKADFKPKLTRKLYKYDPNNPDPGYQAEIFSEMYRTLPQFKAHVAIYVERNYCFVVNDEDHSDPQSLLTILKEWEVRWLNQWIVNRNNRVNTVRKEA